MKQRDALIIEIQLLKETAVKERDELTAGHESELQQLETELSARSEDALRRRESGSRYNVSQYHCLYWVGHERTGSYLSYADWCQYLDSSFVDSSFIFRLVKS